MSDSQALQVNSNGQHVMAPRTLSEAMEYAKMIAASSFCPAQMKGKSGDVLVAMQMGAEVGLSPLQALQNIAVINGRPSIWGDAALALVIASPQYVSHREWMEGSIAEGNLTAFCAITRKGSEEYVKSFSMEEAKKANLWSKAGVWQQYPQRMLQMRARAFAIRDKFADALRGINVREEVEDYQPAEPAQKRIPVTVVSMTPSVSAESENATLEEIHKRWAAKIEACTTMDELKTVFDDIRKLDFRPRPDLFKSLIEQKDSKKNTIQFNQEWDGEPEIVESVEQ